MAFDGELTYAQKVNIVCHTIRNMRATDRLILENVYFQCKRTEGHFGVYWTAQIPDSPFYADFHLTFCTWDAINYTPPPVPSSEQAAFKDFERFAKTFGPRIWPLLEQPDIEWPPTVLDNKGRTRTLLYLNKGATKTQPFFAVRDCFINMYNLDQSCNTARETQAPHLSVDSVYTKRL